MMNLERAESLQWLSIAGIGLVLGTGCSIALSTLPLSWTVALVAGVLGVSGLAVLGEVRRVLLAAICIDIPLQLDVYFGYDFFAGGRGALGGLGVSVTTASLVILYGLWLADRACGVRETPVLRLRSSGPTLLYVACAVISTLVASNIVLSAYEIFLLLQMLLLYIYVVSWVRQEDDALFLVRMLLVGVILEGSIILLIYLAGYNIDIPGLSTSVSDSHYGDGYFRPGGTLGSPNAAASYLSLLLGAAVGLWLTKPRPLDRWIAAAACGLGGIALIVTLSRGGWIATGLSISILCAAAWYRGWLPPSAPILFALIGGLVAILLAGAIVKRLTEDDGDSASSRIPLMEMAFRMIEDNPILGVGANNAAIRLDEYSGDTFVGKGEWRHVVHNNFLLIWVEKGLFGLFAFLWFLGATIRCGWRCWRARDRLWSLLALGLMSGVIGHAVHMQVDFFKLRPHVQLLWLSAAVISAIHGVILARQQQPVSAQPSV